MLEKLPTTPIWQLDQGPLIRLTPDVPARQAVEKMSKARRGAVVIQDERGHLIGIVTERDVVRAGTGTDEQWQQRPVSEVMTRDPTSIHENDSVSEAVSRMQRGKFRHLPVVDEEGRPTGLISIRDVLGYIAEQFSQEVLNLPPDPSLEARRRWGG